MAIKIIIPLLVCISMSFFSCDDESPTGSKSNDTGHDSELLDPYPDGTQPSDSVDQGTQPSDSGDQGTQPSDSGDQGTKPNSPDGIQGTWKLVKLVETWNSEVEEIELDGVMSMFFQFKDNQVTAWTYLSMLEDCFGHATTPYTIEDNRLIGEDFEGVEMEDGQVVSTFNTLIAMEAGNLVITTNENVNLEGEVEKWSTKMVFQTYNGIVPPADWPTEECPEYVLAKKKVSKNGKVLSRLLKQ